MHSIYSSAGPRLRPLDVSGRSAIPPPLTLSRTSSQRPLQSPTTPFRRKPLPEGVAPLTVRPTSGERSASAGDRQSLQSRSDLSASSYDGASPSYILDHFPSPPRTQVSRGAAHRNEQEHDR